MTTKSFFSGQLRKFYNCARQSARRAPKTDIMLILTWQKFWVSCTDVPDVRIPKWFFQNKKSTPCRHFDGYGVVSWCFKRILKQIEISYFFEYFDFFQNFQKLILRGEKSKNAFFEGKWGPYRCVMRLWSQYTKYNACHGEWIFMKILMLECGHQAHKSWWNFVKIHIWSRRRRTTVLHRSSSIVHENVIFEKFAKFSISDYLGLFSSHS